MGHIDIKRDNNAQIIGWEINPSFAAEVSDGVLLLGYWPKNSRKILKERFKDRYLVQEIEDSVSLNKLKGVPIDELVSVCFEEEIDVNVTIDSDLIMVAALPNFLDALVDLPEKHAGLYEEVAKYDPNSNSWLPGNDFDGTGGYRLKSAYKIEYCVVTEESWTKGKIKSVSAATAKHFEAIVNHGKPLFGYVESSEQLFVPVGAPLPGLFQRAAILASGLPPSVDSTGKLRVYESISEEFVRRLVTKMEA